MTRALDCRPAPLGEAVEGLYRAFRGYAPSRHVQGCDCCVSPDDQRRLRSKPLRSLEAEDLTRFAFKAMTTWGTVEDYKHHLPRILELAATREGRGSPGLDYDVILGKLSHGGLASWPTLEQQALAAYWHAALRSTLEVEDDDGLFASTLRALLPVELDVEGVLAQLAADERPCAVLQTVRLVRETVPALQVVGRLHDWPDVPGTAVLEAWLRDPARIAYLEAAFARLLDTPQATDIADAADRLRWWSEPP